MHKNDTLFNVAQETISPEALRALQLRKLRKSLRYATEKSLLYRHVKKLSPKDARLDSLEAFARVPFTTKADLLEGGVYDNLCVAREEVSEVHFSSGTTSKPVASFLTQRDIRTSSAYLARTWHMQGVRKESALAMFASYGLFSAGLINHYAIQNIGAFVIPVGNASALKSFELLKDFHANSCVAVASYYSYLIAMAEAHNISLKHPHLKHMIAGGEPFTEKQRRYIENAFGAHLYNQYGLCEINTGIAGECSEKNGLHILADYAYPEVVDPATDAVLKEGEEGELILTTLHKEASPLIRYRTGDITSITHAPCRCGRTMPRISPIKRRVVETVFYKGMKIEVPYIGRIFEGLSSYLDPYMWQIQINSVRCAKDEIIFKIAPKKSDKAILDRVADHIRKSLNLKARVVSFEKEELLNLGNGKLKHVVDSRDA